jgi:hypothetical protein
MGDRERQIQMTEQQPAPTLGAELFGLVEAEQGYAFVSDAVSGLPDKRVFDIARGALKHTEIVARKLRKWLKDHGQQPA